MLHSVYYISLAIWFACTFYAKTFSTIKLYNYEVVFKIIPAIVFLLTICLLKQ